MCPLDCIVILGDSSTVLTDANTAAIVKDIVDHMNAAKAANLSVSLLELLGMFAGSAIITFLLSRLANALYRRLLGLGYADYIASWATVIVACLVLYHGPKYEAALFYIPCATIFMIYDMWKLSRKRRGINRPNNDST